MTRTKLILAGLLAGTLALGTACMSDKSAERAGEPSEPTPQQGETTDQGTTPPPATTPPEGTGVAGDVGRGNSGGARTSPSGQGQLNPENQGTGGAGDDSGYEEDDSQFQKDQELGGNSFPSDDQVPW